MTVKQLVQRGFDNSTRSGKYLRPRCSQCEVSVINGSACHEHGCPNAVHECAGCNNLIPARQKYCDQCG